MPFFTDFYLQCNSAILSDYIYIYIYIKERERERIHRVHPLFGAENRRPRPSLVLITSSIVFFGGLVFPILAVIV